MGTCPSTSPDSNRQTIRQQMPPHRTDNPTLFQPRVLRRRFRAGKEGWLWRAGGWTGSVQWSGGVRPSAKLVRPRRCRRHQGARAGQPGRCCGVDDGGVGGGEELWTLKNRAGPGLVFSSEAGSRVDGWPRTWKRRIRRLLTLLGIQTGTASDSILVTAVGVPSSSPQPSACRAAPLRSAGTEKRLSRIVMMHVVKKRIVASCRCPLPVSARQRAITYCARYKPCYGQGRWRVFLCPSALPAMRGGIWSKWTGSRLPVSVPAQEGRRYCTHPRGTVAFRFICRTEASLPSRGCSLTLTRLARPASQSNVVVLMSCSGREREACQIPPQS